MTLRPSVLVPLVRRDLAALARSPRLYMLASLYLLSQGFLFGTAYLADPATSARSLARSLGYVWLLFAPALAAHAFAPEKESGELRALRGDPLAEEELVLAKALALGLVVVPLVATFALPALASARLGGAPPAALATALLGVELVACMATSVGLLASALAAQAGSALLLGLALLALVAGCGQWLFGGVAASDPLWLLDLLLRGKLDSRPLVLLPALMLACLLGATRVLQAERRAPHIDPETGRRPSALAEIRRLVSGGLARGLPLLLGLLLLAGLTRRAPLSWDVSGYLELTPGFQTQLGNLPGPVGIYRPPPPGGIPQDPLSDLLDEMEQAAPGKVRVAPLDPEVFRAHLRPLGLITPPEDGLVLATAKALRVLAPEELDVPSGSAEAALARSLSDLLAPARRGRLLVADGHGERPRLAQFPGDPDALGRLTRSLEVIGIESAGIWIQGEAEQLGPRDILAVLGPRTPLPPLEVEAIRDHHLRGGPVLLALDPEYPEGGEGLLEALGIESKPATVVDSRGTLAGGGPSTLLLPPSPDHPLGRLLGSTRVVLPSALSLAPGAGDRVLLRSGPGARLASSDEDLRDRFRWTDPGPKVLALTRDGGETSGRLVVLGDSEFATDGVLAAHPGNEALLTGVSAWLVGMPPPAAVPRRGLRVRAGVSREELTTLTQLIGVVPTVLVLTAGLLAWIRWRRRMGGELPPPEPR